MNQETWPKNKDIPTQELDHIVEFRQLNPDENTLNIMGQSHNAHDLYQLLAKQDHLAPNTIEYLCSGVQDLIDFLEAPMYIDDFTNHTDRRLWRTRMFEYGMSQDLRTNKMRSALAGSLYASMEYLIDDIKDNPSLNHDYGNVFWDDQLSKIDSLAQKYNVEGDGVSEPISTKDKIEILSQIDEIIKDFLVHLFTLTIKDLSTKK